MIRQAPFISPQVQMDSGVLASHEQFGGRVELSLGVSGAAYNCLTSSLFHLHHDAELISREPQAVIVFYSHHCRGTSSATNPLRTPQTPVTVTGRPSRASAAASRWALRLVPASSPCVSLTARAQQTSAQ